MSSTFAVDEAALAATTFADLGVPEPMAAAMARRSITAPFPIQSATIPDALAGRDICGRAPTGSGKTIAFGIPLVLGVGKAHSRRPRGLVLVPTRELASQVAHELQQLAKPKGPWIEAFYGGVGFPRQVDALKRGVDIAVCCPGRLADLINQGCADLRDVDFVVVDEADRMADMGFLPEVRRILDQCAKDRQTLLFSATLDGDVDVLITRYQRDPIRHEFHRDDEDASRATHVFWPAERANRIRLTAEIVKRSGPTVVFCRTKRGADRVAKQLENAGVDAAAIHGDRSQAQRERALRSFHKGEVQALVATDVAARGIHVDGVACVVHFDPPHDSKDYVHRSGRTARAGASGLVVSLVLNEVRKDVRRLQRDLGFPQELTPVDLDSIELAPPRAKPARREPDAEPRRERPARPSREKLRAEAPKRTGSKNGPKRRDDRPSGNRSTSASQGPNRAERRAGLQRHVPEVDLDDDREPLPEGKRRPSGAARRKAKRLSAREVETTATRPASPSRPNGSARPKTGPGKPKPKGKGGTSRPGSAKAGGTSTGRRPAPKRSR